MSKLIKGLRFLPEQCEDVKQGRKTMTRRPVLPQPVKVDRAGRWYRMPHGGPSLNCYDCPYGTVGDTVPLAQPNDHVFAKGVITSLAVEQLQAISADDVIAEGFGRDIPLPGPGWLQTRMQNPEFRAALSEGDFKTFWNHIYEPKGLEASSNPWVWVIGFKVAG